MRKIEHTIDSREVAEMVGKAHKNLLADIRNYENELGELKIQPTSFFAESTYRTSQNKIMPCYNVTKKGCEFIAHKLTGVKGTEFTARYIERFHEMEDMLSQPAALPENRTYKSRRKKLMEELKLVDLEIELEEKRKKLRQMKSGSIDLSQDRTFKESFWYLVHQADDEDVDVLEDLVIEQIGWNENSMKIFERFMETVRERRENTQKMKKIQKKVKEGIEGHSLSEI